PVSLYLDSDTDAGNGTEYPIAAGLAADTGSYRWNTAGIAPGTYYVRAVLGSASSYSGPLVVNAAPVLNLTAPSPSSGEDFAQSHLASPWTMTSLSQLQAWFNLTNVTYGPSYLQAGSNAISGGHADPELWYLQNDNGHKIDTTRYHYLTYQMYVQAPNHVADGQYPQVNYGPRVIWSQPGVIFQQDEAYSHYYNRWESVALDLRTVMLAPGYNTTGWTGQVSTFRIDPYEEDGAFGSNVLPQFFQLGNVRLTADPTVAPGGATTISWVPSKSAGTVTLQYSTTAAGGGTTFATVPLGQGGYVWTVNLPAGRYWVTATANDGLNSFSQVSRAPLVVAGTRPCPLNFSDVPSSDVFYPFIGDLACRNVIEGYSDNTFRTSAIATRAMLAKWVVLARGWDLDTTSGPHFTDVATSDPYYPYIETARLHSVLSGYSDGTFKPNNEVSRGQMSKMIVIAMGWAINAPTEHFTDVPSSYVFYGYVETLVAHSAVSGYSDGTFRPNNNLSRGQLAKVLDIAITHP
ncbi:MAG: S-layer homology domain-containing protein, partial [Chloroflexota bacterium]|nr:S-layer homology domain-containing protein [Chloroflexota bacterium]